MPNKYRTDENFSLFECHSCGSSNISAGAYEGEGELVWSHVTCESCGASRTETFRFANATTDEEDGSEVVLYDADKQGV